MEWKVRYIDYPGQFKKYEDEIMGTVRSVLSRGDLMLRQQLRDFESHLADFVGTRFAVGTSNCTDAMHLTLRAAGIGPGDEVITVSHTFVATVAAIHHTGATPVLIDIADDHNMSVDLIKPAITPRTRAIMPVHLNGRVCDMDRVMSIAEEYDLLVIEDSAQALGGHFRGKRGGSIGLAGCFSFYPAKLLGAYGDAGAVTTNSEEIAHRVRALRDHGRDPSGDILCWSFNCRLDNLQAALLDKKLRHLPDWIQRRRELAALYHQGLEGLGQLHLPPPPTEEGPHYDVFQNYEIEAVSKNRLIQHLKEKGVEVLIPWSGKGVHQFKKLGLGHFQLPRTEKFFQQALLLPMNPDLEDNQVEYVCEVVRDFFSK
jgi:dTDP-4-amino-4,6-dideoxygalactose transaminase